MASIQSLGVGSGLLTSELVEDIISAEREATDLRISAEKAEFEARISAYGSIKSTLEQLNSAASGLSSSRDLLINTVTSSDESAVSATASPQAKPGVHSVEVISLARTHTLASPRFEDIDSLVGDGSLTLRFGTTTVDEVGAYVSFEENPDRAEATITIDESNNTLSGIRDTINEAGIGIVASIVDDGDGYVLALTSEGSGEAQSMEITVTEGLSSGLSALAFNAAAAEQGINMTQTVAADDARLIIDGIPIRRETNTVSEVIDGVTFNALAVNLDAPVSVTVAQDTGGIVEKMQEFVDAYNSVKDLADELTAFDEDSATGGLLMGDSTLRGIRSQMRRLLSSTIAGLESGSIRSLVDLGITTNQNNGYRLQLDSDRLVEALQTQPDAVSALLADQKQASDDLVSFTSFQRDTVAGDYALEITQMATQGYLHGAATPGLAGPITIDDDNDSLFVLLDGITAGPISIAQGDYADGAALAQQLQTQINAHSSVVAAGKSVSVLYNEVDQRLELTSSRFGSRSQVGISSADVNVTATLGLALDTGEATAGLDVAGTINGLEGVGAGQFLSLPLGPVAATSGYFRGQSISGFDSPPLTLDASNSTFSISVNGIVSNTITLSQGDYASGTDLAAELEAQINADSNLSSAGAEVSVSYDGVNKRFVVTSAADGLDSIVSFTDVPAPGETALGFTVGAGTPGKAETTVSDAAGGVQVQVLGGATGPRGTVTLVRGAMNQFQRYLDSVVRFDGTLANKVDSLEVRMADLDEETADFDKRMDLLEERLRLQFAAADSLISQLNSTSEYLDQQLSTLPGYTREKN